MDYIEAIKFIEQRTDLSRIPNLTYSTEKFDLTRIERLLRILGDPHRSLKIIHIAGTKGKGSTAAMLATILQSAGYRTGLYISPYLRDLREQIQINRNPISQVELIELVGKYHQNISSIKDLTTFELMTVLAFEYFKQKNTDLVVVEAGLGGKTDATNVVDPLISVITSISYDHMALLGETIVDIASHKAGIIKPGKPVVLGSQVFNEASQIIALEASKNNSKMVSVDEEISCISTSHSLIGQRFIAKFLHKDSLLDREYFLPLLGMHQIKNAATVLCILNELILLGFPVTSQDAAAGLATVHWPCRFEVVSRDPLIILDSAHNADSAQKLKQTISDYLKDQKITLIFGCSIDKDILQMFKELMPICEKVIFTKSEHPRAAEPMKLVELGKGWPNSFDISENIDDAVNKANSMADKRTAIVVAGSVFLAAAAREVIMKQ